MQLAILLFQARGQRVQTAVHRSRDEMKAPVITWRHAVGEQTIVDQPKGLRRSRTYGRWMRLREWEQVLPLPIEGWDAWKNRQRRFRSANAN